MEKAMSEERDPNTLGLTADGQAHLEKVMETKWFDAEMDAFRLAVAVALGQGLEVAEGPLRAGTKWNVGTLDRDGQLKALVLAHAPGAPRPYEYAEKLADVGMKFLREGLVDAQQTLASVVGGVDPVDDSPGESSDEG
jgi:hypothetical protein